MSIARLDEALAQVAQRVTAAGVPCRGVVPTHDGQLLFAMRPAALDLAWASRDGTADFTLNGRPIVPRPGARADDVDATLDRIAAVFADLPPDLLRLFDLRNRETFEVARSAAGLLRLGAAFLVPGSPVWGSWSLEGVRDDAGRILFDLASGTQNVVCAFVPTGTSPAAKPMLRTPLGTLVLLADTRAAQSRERLSNQPERLLAYALATGIHPGMYWVEPVRPSVSTAGGGGHPSTQPTRSEVEGLRMRGASRVASSAADTCAATGTAPQDGSSGSGKPRVGTWLKRSLNRGFAPPDRFFAGYGNDDLLYLGMLYSSGIDTVGHGGNECPVGMPLMPELVGGRAPAPWRLKPTIDRNAHHSVSGVDDRSVILGGAARLQEQLDQKRDAKLVLLTTHCEYEYVGDRTEQIADAHPLAAAGRLVRLHTPMPRFVRQSGEENWWRPIVRRMPTGSAVEPRTVNLVGFAPHGDRSLAEIESLLELAGVRVRARFFPTFDLDELALFSGATATVVRPWLAVRHQLEPLFRERGFAFTELATPDGPTATHAWLDAVARLAGAQPLTEDAWQQALADRASPWEQLRSRSQGIGFAFVLPETYLEEVMTPAFLYGVDLPAFLLEAGFDVNVIVTPGEANTPRDEGAWLATRYPGLRVVHVASADGVPAALRETGSRLVYSELADNPVAAAAGAFAVGPQAFEMGLEGGCRTISRLLALAKSDFFDRLSRYRGAS